MKTSAPKVALGNTPAEQFTETKLKLKNAHVLSLATYIDKKEKSVSRKLKTLIGKPPEVPIKIQALADLHLEATYSREGQPYVLPVPTCPFEGAKMYVALKELEVNPTPGKALPKRSGSNTSSNSSTISSSKSVRWAEQLADVRLID